MNITNVVSETALITLLARVKESQRTPALIEDPVGVDLLGQLEQKLAPVLQRPFFLTGMPDAGLGEKLVLIVEGASHTDLLKTLQAEVDLETYEVPREVYFLPEFPMTETGKINRPEALKLLDKSDKP